MAAQPMGTGVWGQVFPHALSVCFLGQSGLQPTGNTLQSSLGDRSASLQCGLGCEGHQEETQGIIETLGPGQAVCTEPGSLHLLKAWALKHCLLGT